MKRLLKILVTLSMAGCLCALGALKDTEATSYFYATGTSTEHLFKNVKQYYVVDAEFSIVGNDKVYQSHSTSWKSSGSGSYTVNHGAVTILEKKSSTIKFEGMSYITAGNVFDSRTLIATVYY